jgi:outer membrane receptor protein involved in Fe transport
MPSSTARWTARWLAVLFCLVYPTFLLAQSTGGRIVGRVADPSGAVLANVKVTLVNEATGVSRDTQTNESGDYTFVEVVPGSYHVEFAQAGFKKNVQKSVLVEVNQVVTLNSTLQLGEAKETIEVTSEAPLVDTTSTQLGAVVNDRSVNQLPLNARDTYQFLQLQPGVQSQLGGNGDLFYGSDNAGAVSVNGGRGRANNFSVNGGDANDAFVNLPTIQPVPDAIEEFRVLTNTFDAEYGRNSGAVVNVVTKSGTNQFHGNVYEYFRNKVLNAKGYFDTVKPDFKQNQFGGTFGGPIRKDRSFFFVTYEGRRIRQGKSTDTVAVPTDAERAGDFSALGALGGNIVDQTVADVLNGRQNCTAATGGPLPVITTGPWSNAFPNAIIPAACQDPVASDLLRFVPHLSPGASFFQSVPTGRDRQDQVTARIDHRINDKQSLSFYYYFTDESLFQPLAFFQFAGANVPGFGSNVGQRFQQYNLSHTWTLSNNVVNEARFTYMREGQLTFQHPEHTNNVADSCSTPAAQAVCFNGHSDSSAIEGLGLQKIGILPALGPQREGVPDIAVSGGFTIGNNFEGELPQVGNSFQWSDSLTKVKGNHTFKFGADVRRQRFDQTLYFEVSGYFQYTGTGQNDVIPSDGNFYPDYLLGLPDNYQQGSAQRENVRDTGLYLFAQDSWKIRPNVTLNYGLRWELDTIPTDIGHRVQTFRPGQNTSVYPCQLSPQSVASLGTSDCSSVFPTGLVVPGDKGVPAGLTQTYYKAFAPRIGIAWSPGASGKTSIRTGWGLFYNPIEQLVLEQFSAEPPFGVSTFISNPFFNTPFYTQGGQQFPNAGGVGIVNRHPGDSVDWSSFRPILLFGEFQPHMRTQYSAQYNLTIQRDLGKDTVLQVGYVGSQGHRLLATHELNAANPQTCLDLNNVATNVTSFGSSASCSPGAEDNQYSFTVPQGQVFHMPNSQTITGGSGGTNLQLVGLRPYSSPNCVPTTGVGCPPDGTPVFSNIYAQDTIANSAYNSLQASLEKRFSHGLQAELAYTFSKSIDQASSFEEILNPFNFGRTRGLSLFDSRHRLVLSYFWELPVRKFSGFAGKVLDNWAISQITTFQSGFPIHIESFDDTELTASVAGFASAGEPDLIAPFRKLDPHKTANNLGFDPNSFTTNGTDNVNSPSCSTQVVFGCFRQSLLGRFGNSPRTICCGSRTSNTDFSVHKNIAVTERTRFELRAEFFNIFNHTQFFNPDGSTTDGSDFGRVKRAREPRLVQFALKYFF